MLINKAESLADMPEMGPVLPGKGTTRFLPVGSYLIIYRPDERRRIVRILRFWHAARRHRPAR
jgi:plasmid stabilization system protein ParE